MAKAETLDLLAKNQNGFEVEPFLTFTVRDWLEGNNRVVDCILNSQLSNCLAVRSSVKGEDENPLLASGEFHTELNVIKTNVTIIDAVEKVISSYRRNKIAYSFYEENKIIVQDFLENVEVAGVLTTRDLFSQDLYVTIQYDVSGRTNAVTSGKASRRVDLLKSHKNYPEKWNSLLRATINIQSLLNSDDVLIEFAIDENKIIHIFQAKTGIFNNGKSASQGLALRLIRDGVHFVDENKETIWSDMTDWNPAEILGGKPKPLDISLYQFLVTNETWADARNSLGYRTLQDTKLMELIACKPYINVNLSFLSLIPSGLKPDTERKLLNYYLDKLKAEPILHDKVEFEVLHTCLDLNVPSKLHGLSHQGFSDSEIDEIKSALVNLTQEILDNAASVFQEAEILSLELLRNLEKQNSDIGRKLNECKAKGVLPFSKVARLAFIGKQFLINLLDTELISQEWYDCFLQNIESISAKFSKSISNVWLGLESKEQFYAEFGHLRPRTYDITSVRYDIMRIADINPNANHVLKKKASNTEIYDPNILKNISTLLLQCGLRITAQELIDFIRQAIVLRETIKFRFTNSLSNILEEIAKEGAKLNLSRQEMSFLSIRDFLELTKENLSDKIITIRESEKMWKAAEQLRLPSLIFNATNLIFVEDIINKPNYITHAKVNGEALFIDNNISLHSSALKGRIILIEAADPGFDWIFSQDISALITKYGGSASHMAIRCAEFNIPAVIGCGEIMFNDLKGARLIYLDCGRNEVLKIE